MRSLWNGSLAIGKVSIPVSLHKSAEHVGDVSLKTLHAPCGSPLKQDRSCPRCKVNVAAGGEGETVQGFEFAPGQFVTVASGEISAAIGTKQISIDRTIPVDLLDLPMLDETYWLAPSADPAAARAYGALLGGLLKANRAGLGKLGFYSKERIVAIWPVKIDNVMLVGLTTLFPVEGIRTDEATEIRDRVADSNVSTTEISVFGDILELIGVPDTFRWRAVKRFYPSKLKPMLEAKQKGGKVVIAPPQVGSVAPVDLEDALRKSLKAITSKKRTPAAT